MQRVAWLGCVGTHHASLVFPPAQVHHCMANRRDLHARKPADEQEALQARREASVWGAGPALHAWEPLVAACFPVHAAHAGEPVALLVRRAEQGGGAARLAARLMQLPGPLLMLPFRCAFWPQEDLEAVAVEAAGVLEFPVEVG